MKASNCPFNAFTGVERYEFGEQRAPLEPGVFQLMYLNDIPYGASFACPCGCQYHDWIVFVHPEISDRNAWTIKLVNGLPVVRNSLQRHTPCHSHFFIGGIPPKELPGVIEWCEPPRTKQTEH